MITFTTLLPLLLLINSFILLAAAQTQTTPIPVIGVTTGVDANTGQRPIRRNVNDLYARGGPQWDLYILALSEMQATDESDELSYFSLAGIHGLPHKPWNGVEQVDGAPDVGYCPHGQTLVTHALSIASRYPPSFQAAYTDAARTLRLPFWDWASDPSLPIAVMNDTIKVSNTPNSSLSSLSPPNTNGTGGGSGAPSGALHHPSGGQLGTKKGTNLTADSPLKPFHAQFPATNSSTPPSDAGGFFHTSNSVADLRTFGYSYPELNTDWQITDKEKLAAQVKKAVNKLYGSGDDESANGVARREVDEDLNPEDALGEEDDSTVIDGGKEIDENNKITFRRSRLRSLSLSASTSTTNFNSQEDKEGTTSTDGKQTEENNKITFRRSRSLAKSLSSANSKKPKRQTYGQSPTKNYYYTAELSVDRSEVPLPCTISLIVNEVVMGRMRGLGHVDMTPNRIIPFLRGNMTVEIRANDETLTDPSTVPSLHLDIQDWEYIPRKNASEFPIFQNPRKWPIGIRGPGGHGGYGGGGH
ncbi:unnamed protein product [Sordaria macrospora k-hell]|uniref:WGS project CABT00000000 data, contig 2.29 n=1 Tax=Sordaria macrospora (strain ATCC MYA-333 / DSM 997 / K(L3346) / K-hell) TaxID=771870 RepID=F7W515_SORMK|nr:uncharacterized protein SMAC_07902 [Sordaria macrospora k-hell]CCC12603.1 unnamed protein product [Sordaria macrospora k-hell]